MGAAIEGAGPRLSAAGALIEQSLFPVGAYRIENDPASTMFFALITISRSRLPPAIKMPARSPINLARRFRERDQ
jgi:hypothetical protein